MRRIVHLSDLHFGWNDKSLVDSLCTKVHEVRPDLTIVSGDFVEHATKEEFVQAKEFYDSLPRPIIAVPGNHDLPFYNFALRAYQHLRLYREYITNDMSPFYCDEEIAVMGVNTARLWPIRGGSISVASIAEVEQRLCSVPKHTARILVTHHPFDLPAEYAHRYLLKHGEKALTRLACCLDVLLAGHMHIGASGHVAERFVTPNGSLIFSQAGTAISKRYKGERNSFNLLEIEGPEIKIKKFTWDSSHSIYFGTPEEQVYFRENSKEIRLV